MPVFCTYCGTSFTRDEHLERHILTHTHVKPFKCDTCHMSFARRDLLQRHYTVHGRDQNGQEGLPPNNGMMPKSAGRTPIACSNCAKTKTKCDKKFPCSRCAGRNLKCTLRPTRRQSKQQVRIPEPSNGSSTSSSDPVTSQTPSGSNGNSPQEPSNPLDDDFTHSSVKTSPADSKQSLGGSFFDQSPSAHTPGILSGVISPLPTPTTSSFMSQRPISGYSEFAGPGSGDITSSEFNMDWSQIHLPMQFNPMTGRSDLMMTSSAGFDMSTDGMMPLMNDLSIQMPHVHTPIATPRLEGSLSEMELGSSANMFYPSARHASISESCTSTDLTAVIAAQEGWSCFRCTPTIPASACPKTARLNLEKLEQTLRNHEGWMTWRPSWDESDFADEHLIVMPVQESTRDKLMAITQSFLHKALDIHKEDNCSPRGDSPSSTSSNFVLLPPARVLHTFLRSYANSFERYFPMSSRNVLDCNDLIMNSFNDKAASLLLLMMIAQGAMALPSFETRWLTSGLTEACRISLFDLIEKNIVMAGDSTVLHSALLFTVQAAWSGDKWQMDIAMGQRGMYIAMLRHHGNLEPRHAMTPPTHQVDSPDGLWCEWLHQEAKSRLIYSWAMVDQDLSFFHDTAPLFAVTEFGAPMPDAESLWRAKDAGQWSSTYNQIHQCTAGYSSVGSGASPLCLRDLFRHFLTDQIISQGIDLTALHLRLLLHPLQAMVHQYRQLLSCFPNNGLPSQQDGEALSAASTRARLVEVQTLLRRWQDLVERYLQQQPACALVQASLVMFHLISLNAITDFPEIERLARREDFDGTYQQLVWIHKKCITDVEEAIVHCGQVLRLVRQMPRGIRSPWWAGAIYRVSLILWTDSLTHNDTISTASNGLFPISGPAFAVDSLPADHALISRYLMKREGVPTLTKRDGSQMPIDNGYTLLQHCVSVLDEGNATRFSDGIKSKLQRLALG